MMIAKIPGTMKERSVYLITLYVNGISSPCRKIFGV